MKFNLLKITLLLIFVCSTYSHLHKKEESNTLFNLFGKVPFDGENDEQILQSISKANMDDVDFGIISIQAVDLLKKMLIYKLINKKVKHVKKM